MMCEVTTSLKAVWAKLSHGHQTKAHELRFTTKSNHKLNNIQLVACFRKGWSFFFLLHCKQTNTNKYTQTTSEYILQNAPITIYVNHVKPTVFSTPTTTITLIVIIVCHYYHCLVIFVEYYIAMRTPPKTTLDFICIRLLVPGVGWDEEQHPRLHHQDIIRHTLERSIEVVDISRRETMAPADRQNTNERKPVCSNELSSCYLSWICSRRRQHRAQVMIHL